MAFVTELGLSVFRKEGKAWMYRAWLGSRKLTDNNGRINEISVSPSGSYVAANTIVQFGQCVRVGRSVDHAWGFNRGGQGFTFDERPLLSSGRYGPPPFGPPFLARNCMRVLRRYFAEGLNSRNSTVV